LGSFVNSTRKKERKKERKAERKDKQEHKDTREEAAKGRRDRVDNLVLHIFVVIDAGARKWYINADTHRPSPLVWVEEERDR